MTDERRLASREGIEAIRARDAAITPCDCGPKDRPSEKRAEGWFHRTSGTNIVHVGMTQEERDRRSLLAALPQPATEPALDKPCDPWASTGDGLTPVQRLSLAHSTGIEVGRAEAAQPSAEVERLRAVEHEATLFVAWFDEYSEAHPEHLLPWVKASALRAALAESAR